MKLADYARAEQAMDALLAELDGGDEQPRLLSMHLLEPHSPYKALKHGTPFERYLAEVQVVDKQLGRLLERIQAADLEPRVILIVSADHGEAFGEHGSEFHASTLYDELLRVPLIVMGRGIRARQIDEPVSLIDLGPTLLDLFGAPTPNHFLGESLLPLLQGNRAKLTRPIAAEAGRRMQALIFPDGYKVIVDLEHQSRELYDLASDPAEKYNLYDRNENRRGYLEALTKFFRAHGCNKPGYEPPWRRF